MVEKILKIKEVLNYDYDKLDEIMTDNEYQRMLKLGLKYTWELWDTMKDGCKEALKSGSKLDDNFVSISQFLDWLEEIKEV